MSRFELVRNNILLSQNRWAHDLERNIHSILVVSFVFTCDKEMLMKAGLTFIVFRPYFFSKWAEGFKKKESF